MLGLILVVLHALDFEQECQAVGETHDVIRHVIVADAKIFICNHQTEPIILGIAPDQPASRRHLQTKGCALLPLPGVGDDLIDVAHHSREAGLERSSKMTRAAVAMNAARWCNVVH